MAKRKQKRLKQKQQRHDRVQSSKKQETGQDSAESRQAKQAGRLPADMKHSPVQRAAPAWKELYVELAQSFKR